MAKQKMDAASNNAANETKHETSNVTRETHAPVKSIADLQSELKAAKKAWTDANTAADYEETPEVIKAQAAVNAARQALKAAEAAEAKAEAERVLSEKMNHAIAEIKSVFNLDDAGIESIKNAANVENSTLRTSIALVFGNKPVIAKEGQSGKSLTKNDGKPKAGTKNDELKSLFDAGKTKQELFDMGFTKSDLNNATYKLKYVVNKETGGFMPNPNS